MPSSLAEPQRVVAPPLVELAVVGDDATCSPGLRESRMNCRKEQRSFLGAHCFGARERGARRVSQRPDTQFIADLPVLTKRKAH